jgi:hypothetical protein
LRLAIGVETDQRLQQRGDALQDQRDQSDLTEAQIERALEDRIDRRQQRHDQVVQQMAKADRRQDDKCSAAGLLPAHDGLCHGRNLSSLRATKPGAAFLIGIRGRYLSPADWPSYPDPGIRPMQDWRAGSISS